MNDRRRRLNLEILKLDLRGLPRSSAEAVASHLPDSLAKAFAETLPENRAAPNAPGDLHLTIDPAAPPQEIAGAIAAALARTIRSSEAAPGDSFSPTF